MEDFLNDMISDNTADSLPEEPETEGGDADAGENQESTGDGETPSGGSEESGNGDTSGDTENTSGVPSGSESGAASDGLGGNDSPSIDGAVFPDDFRQAVDGLNAAAGRLSDGVPDFGDLLESVRSLVNAISEQSLSVQSNMIPINGYRDYDYPITVIWEVSPSAINTSMKESRMYYTAEEFEEGYQGMCDLVGVTLKSFRILRIQDCSDEEYVYDADNVQEEPELPEDGETEDTFQEDILAALSGLHEDLQTISMNDLEYHDNQIQLQEQYTAAQELNTDLQYHILATNIAIGFALLLTLGYTVSHGFLQKMKAG